MTCAVAFPYDSGYVVAADRCASDGHRAYTRARKVFRIGDVRLAMAGTLSHCQQIVRKYASQPDHSPDMLGDLVMQALSHDKTTDVEFLHVTRTGLTHVDGAGALTDPLRPYIGIGNGADFAAGYIGCAWRAGMTLGDARALARRALKETSTYCLGVAPPFDVYVVR